MEKKGVCGYTMNATELRDWIDSLTQDINFVYLGIGGCICSFTRTDISVVYGDEERRFQSIDAVLEEPFIGGKPLKVICEEITFE